ncbi:MAG: 2-oxo-4-hydroxy-4-carboxy-5-ureidoimidazoline decarboxylase [Sandaracinaceae bacterium]
MIALDRMSDDDARAALTRCCGARAWVDAMLAARPFGSAEAAMSAARKSFSEMEDADHLEAFSHHPRIGEDLGELRKRFAGTASLSEREQASVSAASEETLEALREINRAYFERYGFIFIVCASGKTADEMLGLCRARMNHGRDEELRIAAAEQIQIAELRLAALLTDERPTHERPTEEP